MKSKVMKTQFKMLFMVALLFLITNVIPEISLGQEVPPTQSAAREGKPAKKEALTFEDELVEGATQKPELFYLLQKKNFNYKKLIKLRENFLPEMRKTSEAIQRGGTSP